MNQVPVFGLVVGCVALLWIIKEQFFPSLPSVLQHDFDHPLLTEAARRAQDSLESFRLLAKERPGTCIVKFPLKTDGGAFEHLWAELLDWQGATMVIKFESVPVSQTAPIPEKEERNTSELEDWAVVLPDGKMMGGFSQRAMIQIVREREKNPRWGLRRRLALEEARFVDF